MTFARQAVAASLNVLTLAAYSLHSSLLTGSLGAVGAAGSSGVGARFTWLNGKALSQVEHELAQLADGDPILAAADRLADAADSNDEEERAEGLHALFTGFIEPLSDGFSKAGRAGYARLVEWEIFRVIEGRSVPAPTREDEPMRLDARLSSLYPFAAEVFCR